MAFDIVTMNAFLLQTATAIRADLNVGVGVRLFVNDFAPGPGNALLQFQEANFPGYARWNLNGVFGPPIKVSDGSYATRSTVNTWVCTGASSSVVYGWYAVKNNRTYLAGRFTSPYTLGPFVTIALSLSVLAFDPSLC